jgi:uncharacterized protein (TIGR03790 family)
MAPRALLLGLFLGSVQAAAGGLRADVLGVLYDRNDAASRRIAAYYVSMRHIPAVNVVGLTPPQRDRISREELNTLRRAMLQALPTRVQSLLLVWSKPWAVECMSVTTAFAAGYHPDFCEPGCRRTRFSPLFDIDGWLPADTVGWQPAMLLPSGDEALARAVIDRGIRADATAPAGTVYLIRTADSARNVRAAGYADTAELLGARLAIRDVSTPIVGAQTGIIAYFTGVAQVQELSQLHFRPGAVADHLTSTGGVLDGGRQMSALEWLRQGATGSYGTVSEPCNVAGKFPSPMIFLQRYLQGGTLLEAYWKSVAMPGQGLFIGEPLARPYPPAQRR